MEKSLKLITHSDSISKDLLPIIDYRVDGGFLDFLLQFGRWFFFVIESFEFEEKKSEKPIFSIVFVNVNGGFEVSRD